jgi:hypothetical protein
MPNGVLLVLCQGLLLVQQIPEPSEVLSLREMITCTAVERDWELCQVFQGDERRGVLPIPPQVFLSAVIKMLELLLHHHLLEVEDTLEGGPSGEVGHVMLKLFLV